MVDAIAHVESLFVLGRNDERCEEFILLVGPCLFEEQEIVLFLAIGNEIFEWEGVGIEFLDVFFFQDQFWWLWLVVFFNIGSIDVRDRKFSERLFSIRRRRRGRRFLPRGGILGQELEDPVSDEVLLLLQRRDEVCVRRQTRRVVGALQRKEEEQDGLVVAVRIALLEKLRRDLEQSEELEVGARAGEEVEIGPSEEQLDREPRAEVSVAIREHSLRRFGCDLFLFADGGGTSGSGDRVGGGLDLVVMVELIEELKVRHQLFRRQFGNKEDTLEGQKDRSVPVVRAANGKRNRLDQVHLVDDGSSREEVLVQFVLELVRLVMLIQFQECDARDEFRGQSF